MFPENEILTALFAQRVQTLLILLRFSRFPILKLNQLVHFKICIVVNLGKKLIFC